MDNTPIKSSNTIRHHATVTRARREQQNSHRGAVVWFTGLSGSGKSTLAHAVEEELHKGGCRTYVFDGDNVRHGLCGDLSFSEADCGRKTSAPHWRDGQTLHRGRLYCPHRAFISPYRADRQRVQNMVGSEDFIEIYCRCSLKVCEERDVKGLYRKARAGEIKDYTGISAPYEEPDDAALILDTGNQPLAECASKVIELLQTRKII